MAPVWHPNAVSERTLRSRTMVSKFSLYQGQHCTQARERSVSCGHWPRAGCPTSHTHSALLNTAVVQFISSLDARRKRKLKIREIVRQCCFITMEQNDRLGSASPHVAALRAITAAGQLRRRLVSFNSKFSAAQRMSIVSLGLPRNSIVSIDERTTRNNSSASLVSCVSPTPQTSGHVSDATIPKRLFSALAASDDDDDLEPARRVKDNFQFKYDSPPGQIDVCSPPSESPLDVSVRQAAEVAATVNDEEAASLVGAATLNPVVSPTILEPKRKPKKGAFSLKPPAVLKKKNLFGKDLQMEMTNRHKKDSETRLVRAAESRSTQLQSSHITKLNRIWNKAGKSLPDADDLAHPRRGKRSHAELELS